MSVGVVGAGTVDGGAGGLYPVGWVVLPVGLCPCYQWTGCSWWALPVLPTNQSFLPNVALRLPQVRVVAPYFWCLIRRPQWVGLWVAHFSCAQMGVLVTIRHGEVLRTVLVPQQNRDQARHTSPVAIRAKHTA